MGSAEIDSALLRQSRVSIFCSSFLLQMNSQICPDPSSFLIFGDLVGRPPRLVGKPPSDSASLPTNLVTDSGDEIGCFCSNQSRWLRVPIKGGLNLTQNRKGKNDWLNKTSYWLWRDLNLRPWAYESPATTAELQNLILVIYLVYHINSFFSKIEIKADYLYWGSLPDEVTETWLVSRSHPWLGHHGVT